MKNIIETAVAAPTLKTLVTAITAAGLVDTISGPEPFTVFAPNDEAFAKLPKETLDKVLADKAQLTKILTYHVVSGKKMAADISTITKAETLQGGDVVVNSSDGVHINDAKVVTADIECTNGVIHVIDTVLMPK